MIEFTDQELQSILILLGKADPLEAFGTKFVKDKIQAYFVAKQQEQNAGAAEVVEGKD